MHTYEVRLSPKPGNPGGNLTTEVRAYSDTQARTIAESQYPTYRVEAIRRLGA
jgi:prolyl-tRNA synthetase